MRRIRSAAAGLVVASAVLVQATAANGDTRDERERVRREQAAVAADLDVLEAQDAEIAAALEVLGANLAAEQEALVAAEAEVARTEGRLRAARAAERRLEAEIQRLEDDVRIVAVQAYIGNGTTNRLGLVLTSDDPAEATERGALAESVAVDINDVLDRLARTRQRLEAARRRAATAAADAEASRSAVEDRLELLATAQAQHAALAAEVDARIESRLAEAAALASLDADLSARIQAEEAELVRRLAREGGPLPPMPRVDPPPVRTVRGITVHEDIADDLERLLAAAEADGIELGGGGYRSSDAQWRLRVQHCPDPVASPPAACSPPTARVGTSNHERGLAVDFTSGGHAITTQDDPAFVWLAEHAPAHGFHNLPSEPWHWSVDGS